MKGEFSNLIEKYSKHYYLCILEVQLLKMKSVTTSIPTHPAKLVYYHAVLEESHCYVTILYRLYLIKYYQAEDFFLLTFRFILTYNKSESFVQFYLLRFGVLLGFTKIFSDVYVYSN